MTQENVDLVLESARRFRPGGLDEWAELWHPDVRLTVPPGWPEPGPFIGLEAVRAQFERLLDSFPSFDIEHAEVVGAGGAWVVVKFQIPVRGAASGLSSGIDVAGAYRVQDGLLTECAMVWEVDEALKFAGL